MCFSVLAPANPSPRCNDSTHPSTGLASQSSQLRYSAYSSTRLPPREHLAWDSSAGTADHQAGVRNRTRVERRTVDSTIGPRLHILSNLASSLLLEPADVLILAPPVLEVAVQTTTARECMASVSVEFAAGVAETTPPWPAGVGSAEANLISAGFGGGDFPSPWMTRHASNAGRTLPWAISISRRLRSRLPRGHRSCRRDRSIGDNVPRLAPVGCCRRLGVAGALQPSG